MVISRLHIKQKCNRSIIIHQATAEQVDSSSHHSQFHMVKKGWSSVNVITIHYIKQNKWYYFFPLSRVASQHRENPNQQRRPHLRGQGFPTATALTGDASAATNTAESEVAATAAASAAADASSCLRSWSRYMLMALVQITPAPMKEKKRRTVVEASPAADMVVGELAGAALDWATISGLMFSVF